MSTKKSVEQPQIWDPVKKRFIRPAPAVTEPESLEVKGKRHAMEAKQAAEAKRRSAGGK